MAISTDKPLSTGCIYGHPPIRLFGAESGDAAFLEVWLLAAVVADNLVDFYDDVLGNFGINGLAIDHLGEGDALVIVLSD